MTRIGRIFLGLGLAAILSGSLQAAEVFTARMLTGGGPNQEPVQTLRIEIDDYSNPGENIELWKTLDREGYEAFMSQFRGLKKGVLRFMSGRGFNITLHVAESVPTEKGRKLLLFSESQSWDSDTRKMQMEARGYLFLVIEIQLDAKGKGSGSLYTQAKIRLGNDGMVTMEAFNSAPKQIIGVHPMK